MHTVAYVDMFCKADLLRLSVHGLSGNGRVLSPPSAGVSRRNVALKNVAKFALSPAEPPVLATYVAGTKGAPSSVSLYDLSDGAEEPQPLARKSFFRVRFFCFSGAFRLLA